MFGRLNGEDTYHDQLDIFTFDKSDHYYICWSIYEEYYDPTFPSLSIGNEFYLDGIVLTK